MKKINLQHRFFQMHLKHLALAVMLLILPMVSSEGGRAMAQNLPQKHYTALLPETLLALQNKGMPVNSSVVIRAYKHESELEIWKRTEKGSYAHFKTYPICRWSGKLGPKQKEGDYQVPEGFYAITQKAMNPNSSYYLSFNVGYPNTYDASLQRTGGLIMVHGACASVGCFAMSDDQIKEIYALVREAFTGGQSAIQMQSYPFRFTPANMAKFRNNPNMPFWKTLKEGADHFELTKQEVQVGICENRYVFNTNASEPMKPNAACPAFSPDVSLIQKLAAKQQRDAKAVEKLLKPVKGKTPQIAEPTYKNGGSHPKFREMAVLGNPL